MSYVVPVKSKGKISQNFVAFSEYMNFKMAVLFAFLRENAVEGEHITDIYITETGTTELENLSHNIIDVFIIET